MNPDSAGQNNVIEVRNLVKAYGDNYALRGLDLRVREGESVAVFGPNGAGKTTFIKVLATLTRPSGGEARIAGYDLKDEAIKVRSHIGVVAHQTLMYDDLSAHENLKFYGKMYGVTDIEDRIHFLVKQVDLEARLHDPVRTLSRGMQQRLAIARALVHDPPILLLDEPGTGLDQHANTILVDLLKSGDRRKTVVMTTHSLEQGLAIGTRVVILTKGRIVYEDSGRIDIGDLKDLYYQHTGVRAQ